MANPDVLPAYYADNILYVDAGLTNLLPVGVIVSSGTVISGSLTYNSLANIPEDAVGITAVVQDTTPELGGNLDALTNNIINVGSLAAATGAFSTSLTISGVPVVTTDTGVTDHGALSGLNDDEDHPQFLLLDGSREMTGELNMGLNVINHAGGIIASGTVDAQTGFFDSVESPLDNTIDVLRGITVTGVVMGRCEVNHGFISHQAGIAYPGLLMARAGGQFTTGLGTTGPVDWHGVLESAGRVAGSDDYATTAMIIMRADGVSPAVGSSPGAIEFRTTPTGSNAPPIRILLDADGVTSFESNNVVGINELTAVTGTFTSGLTIGTSSIEIKTDRILLPDGSTTAPAISFKQNITDNGTAVGIYRDDDDTLGFVTNDTLQMAIEDGFVDLQGGDLSANSVSANINGSTGAFSTSLTVSGTPVNLVAPPTLTYGDNGISTFTLTSGTGTYENTGLVTPTLEPGTYFLTGNIRTTLTLTSGTEGFISVRLRDLGMDSVVDNSEILCGYAPVSGTKYVQTTTFSVIYDLESSGAISVEATSGGLDFPVPTFTTREITTDSNGKSNLEFFKLGPSVGGGPPT